MQKYLYRVQILSNRDLDEKLIVGGFVDWALTIKSEN